MNLIKCPDCGKMISPRAEACPGCGCPNEFFGEESNTIENKENHHRLMIDNIIEEGRETAVLIMVDEEGEEKKISQNYGRDVIDFCETSKYIFYVLYDTDEYNKNKNKYFQGVCPSHIYRYQKDNQKVTRISPDEGFCISIDKNDYRCDSNDSTDEYRDHEGKMMPKALFTNEQRLVLRLSKYLNHIDGVILCLDLDGNPIRVIWEGEYKKLCHILWLHGQDLWIVQNSDGMLKRDLLHYSLSDNRTELVMDKHYCSATDGKVMYIIQYSDQYNMSYGDFHIYSAKMDGTEYALFCEIKNENYFSLDAIRVNSESALYLAIVKRGFSFDGNKIEEFYEMQLEQGIIYDLWKIWNIDSEYTFVGGSDVEEIRRLKNLYMGKSAL